MGFFKKKTAYRKYGLQDIPLLKNSQTGPGVGSHRVYHDISLKKWRITYQLDEARYWFLSVFIGEDGASELKFSLDYEDAHDSHYEFTDEAYIREILKQPGDEELYLHEILIRFAEQHGAEKLLRVIYPSVTAQFHF